MRCTCNLYCQWNIATLLKIFFQHIFASCFNHITYHLSYHYRIYQYNFIPWLWLILLLCDYMILFMLIWQFNFDSFFEVVLFTLFPWYVWIAFYLMMINFIWYVCNCAVWVTSSLISLDDWIIFWRVWMLSWIVGLSVAFNFT